MPVLVTLCNRSDDKYEFGYNGQMKMNEVTGMGNWNTAQHWEYATRSAHRANMDPKPNHSMSPYAVFNGNPILYSDPNGDTIRVKGFVTKWDGKGNPIALADQVNAQKLWDEMLDYLRLNNLAEDADLLINSTNNYDLYFYTHAHERLGGPAFKPYFDGNRLTYSGTPSLFLSPSYGLLTDNGYLMSPLEIAIHELAHGGDHERNPCLAWLNSF